MKCLTSWAEYVKSISYLVSAYKTGQSHITKPEFVTNNTNTDMYYCVSVKGTNVMEVVRLQPGESMTKYPEVTDVEGEIDNSGTVTKFTGMFHGQFVDQKWITDAVCEYVIKDIGMGIDKDCKIVDREKFKESTKDPATGKSIWERCFEHVPPGRDVEVRPGCGERDFDRCEKIDVVRGGGSDLVSIIRPIELPGGLFKVGYESLTHYISSPNFEGVSPVGWKYPLGHYNRLGYDDAAEGYYNDHFMDCHKIVGSGKSPHGIYQDLNVRIKGKIRFGVHAKRRSGADDAELTIAIWSLDRNENSFKRYRLPIGGWFDCYTDAEVDLDDRLRIEIYLPEEGGSYFLGGAYIIRQIV